MNGPDQTPEDRTTQLMYSRLATAVEEVGQVDVRNLTPYRRDLERAWLILRQVQVFIA